jgi:hypothetical protein
LPDYLSAIILFGVGLVAGFINVNAGGGSTLTLPTLIFLGLDSALANGTNRIAIFIQNISAVYSFKKEKYQQFNISMKLSLLTLPGSIVGALLAVNLSDAVFQKILGVVMIGIILSDEGNTRIPFSAYIAMFGIGFYGGFIQVGVGFILMAALQRLMKLNLVYVNMHKVFIVLVYTIPALLIFIFTDNVNWFFGIALAIGNATGAWWAAKFAVKKGEKLIKIILVIAVFIMSLKLLGVF